MSLMTAILSIALALVIFLPRENSILLLSSYGIFMLVITVVAFKLRVRLLSIEKSEEAKETGQEAEKGTRGWKTVLLVFLVLLTVLTVPLFLAGILPLLLGDLGRYIWFILIVSAASGISIAEILFYLYAR